MPVMCTSTLDTEDFDDVYNKKKLKRIHVDKIYRIIQYKIYQRSTTPGKSSNHRMLTTYFLLILKTGKKFPQNQIQL